MSPQSQFSMPEQPSESTNSAVVHWTSLQRWILIGSLIAVAVSFNLRALGSQDDDAGTPPNNYQTNGVMPTISAGGNCDSNNRMIAVTGLDVTGQSVLYLIDTLDMQMAIYQASGGASSTRGLRLIAARNINLDLQLDGFNDKTEDKRGRSLTYKDLEKQFRDNGLLEDEE